MENNAIMRIDEDSAMIADLTNASTFFCSLSGKTPEEKGKLFKAMNDPEKRLADCIGKKINAKDIFAEIVQCKNDETGEVTTCPRVVIIDDKGIGYQAVSIGIFSAIKKLIGIFGEPTWETPIPITVKQITKGVRRMLTLTIES